MTRIAVKQCSLRRGLLGTIIGVSALMPLNIALAQETAPSVDESPAEAETTEAVEADQPAAPAEVSETLAAMDKAANQQQLKRLMRFYSPDFTHSDGLSQQAMKQVIKKFWSSHEDLNYKTELLSWETDKDGGGVATTKTTITGSRTAADQAMKLTATVHAHQRWVDKQMVEQTITAEESQLTSGERPPEVTVNLPEQVKVGGQFNFDVIVDEPLNERLLLGTAIEEPISAERYLTQPELKLELLPAGGLFKVGQAPKKPTSEWISAVLVQDGGMIIINRRLQVVRNKPKAKQSLAR